jgi:transposase
MPATAQTAIAVIGIDIGKNSFHVVGQDRRGQIVLRQKWSRHQVEARFANMPPCLIGMEACVGAHHLSRRLKAAWPRRSADAGEVCAALFQGPEE